MDNLKKIDQNENYFSIQLKKTVKTELYWIPKKRFQIIVRFFHWLKTFTPAYFIAIYSTTVQISLFRLAFLQQRVRVVPLVDDLGRS